MLPGVLLESDSIARIERDNCHSGRVWCQANAESSRKKYNFDLPLIRIAPLFSQSVTFLSGKHGRERPRVHLDAARLHFGAWGCIAIPFGSRVQ
jgi:hypothetical protein